MRSCTKKTALMKNKLFILLLSIVTISSSLSAQQLYTAHVGTFVDVKPQDFDDIRPLGFVYAHELEGNLNQVYLGNYTEESKAQQIVGALYARGFTSAQVLPIQLNGGQEVAVIQVATRYTNRPLNWDEFKRAGQLNVSIENERIKVFTVTFPDINTAKNMLPKIQALGYSDAFVKTINNARLIPVTPISTGIKEDLFQLNLTETKTPVREQAPTPAVQAEVDNYNSTQGRIVTTGTPSVPKPAQIDNENVTARSVVVAPKPEAVPVSSQPVVAANSNPTKPADLAVALPTIRGNKKRTSALNLQKTLKGEGYYNSTLDGYYGNGTSTAFQEMWAKDATIQKYKILATNTPSTTSADAFFGWEEVNLLYTIAMDINPAAISQTSKLNAAAVRRYQLSLTDQPLGPSQLTLLSNWQNSTWQNISTWAANDPFLSETSSALAVAYFQSQVRLEDYYMDKGFKQEEAKVLALASLQAIVGVAFERF